MSPGRKSHRSFESREPPTRSSPRSTHGTDGEASRRRREAPRAVAPVGRRAGVADLDRERQRKAAAGRVAADARPRRAELEDALVGRAHVVQSVRRLASGGRRKSGITTTPPVPSLRARVDAAAANRACVSQSTPRPSSRTSEDFYARRGRARAPAPSAAARGTRSSGRRRASSAPTSCSTSATAPPSASPRAARRTRRPARSRPSASIAPCSAGLRPVIRGRGRSRTSPPAAGPRLWGRSSWPTAGP